MSPRVVRERGNVVDERDRNTNYNTYKRASALTRKHLLRAVLFSFPCAKCAVTLQT